MKRREFVQAAGISAASAAGLSYAARRNRSAGPAPTRTSATTDAHAQAPAPAPAPTRDLSPARAPKPVAASGAAMGTNLSGMEWAKPGLRYGLSTMPNLNFTVPRAADVKFMANNGYTKNRLPIQWELLQPMLFDTVASPAVQKLVGRAGAFHAGYEGYITAVLDAHAAAGITCIIDCHNYCRYQDFIYEADGSVNGITAGWDAVLRPYTTNPSKVQERIFALAPGATLKIEHFVDFWRRVVHKWKDHPGLGGYGLMNEPHDLPMPGGTVASYGGEDLTIWPTFAQAAVNAIRANDASTPIYLAGNEWQAAMTLGSKNPTWPLVGANLVYDVHMYLDAYSNGFAFDYDTEVAKYFSAGFGNLPINIDTGLNRIRMATDWAASRGVKLALTEIGMPIDDSRWEEMFHKAVNHARATNCEIYSWMGGNHWPARNYAINHVPGFHQNKTLEPTVSGPLKAAAGLASATLFDDGPGDAPSGTAVTITVYARGYLAHPLSLTVSSNNGGILSQSLITLAAGANSQTTYTYTSASNRVATLSYTSDGQLGGQVPPPRKVYSLTDPVAYAATSLGDAAMAILAKYSASKWEMADGHTDYMQGAPAASGQPLRAVSDSGFGSSFGNAMDMLNWTNKETGASGDMSVPVMRVAANGRKNMDCTVNNTWGLWCKKSESQPGIQANPKNKVPYQIHEGHFAIACVSVANGWSTGSVFQASKAEDSFATELGFANSAPQARWTDRNGKVVALTSPVALPVNTPAVLSLTSVPGLQRLRVNSAATATASSTLSASEFNQMLIGWGFQGYYPRVGFQGNVYAVVTGKGAPTLPEMAVLEKYLGTTAGLEI